MLEQWLPLVTRNRVWGGATPRPQIACIVGLCRQGSHESVVVTFANVLVEAPCSGKLHGILEHLQRVRLEDQLLAPAQGGVIVVAFEGRRNVTLPKMQIPVRILLKGLVC